MSYQTFSLNRLIIKTKSGDPKPAYDVLSAKAISRAMSQHANQPSDEIDPRKLDGWFEDEKLETVAHDIAADFGYGLVGLLVALRETYWHGVENIWLGGGLVSGKMGPLVVEIANAQQNLVQFHLAPYPQHLPLIGIARYAPPSIRQALVFDFGGTNIKCGRAIYVDDGLAEMEALPFLPPRFLAVTQENIAPEAVQPLLQFIVNVVCERWRGEEFIGIAISTHMHNKQPISRGGYGDLRMLSERVIEVVQGEIVQAIGQPVAFEWEHDGTAAAAAYTHLPNSAAITFGTAIGGAVAAETRLRPLTPAFQVK
ncbi:MAG: hypothetical protein L0154_20210 [Chloroflexi bacterium]|nr:hypothetical protein [Chloroflexota bacterium]